MADEAPPGDNVQTTTTTDGNTAVAHRTDADDLDWNCQHINESSPLDEHID